MSTNVILQQAVVTALSSLATAQVASETSQVGDWNTVAKASAPNGKTADVDIVDAMRRQYVFDYCVAAGIKAAISKDRVVLANPDAASKADADAFDDAKRRARSAFGMGLNRAWVRCGIAEPEKQNTGGRKSKEKEADASKTQSTTILPPSFRAKVIDLQSRMVAFQTSAKLRAVDRADVGKMAELIASIVADLDNPAPTPPSK